MNAYRLAYIVFMLTYVSKNEARIKDSNADGPLFQNGTDKLLSNATEKLFSNGTEILFSNGTETTFSNGTENLISNGTENLFSNGTKLFSTEEDADVLSSNSILRENLLVASSIFPLPRKFPTISVALVDLNAINAQFNESPTTVKNTAPTVAVTTTNVASTTTAVESTATVIALQSVNNGSESVKDDAVNEVVKNQVNNIENGVKTTETSTNAATTDLSSRPTYIIKLFLLTNESKIEEVNVVKDALTNRETELIANNKNNNSKSNNNNEPEKVGNDESTTNEFVNSSDNFKNDTIATLSVTDNYQSLITENSVLNFTIVGVKNENITEDSGQSLNETSDETESATITNSTLSTTVSGLSQLKLCKASLEVDKEEKSKLDCQWASFKGKQLKVWPNHAKISICTMLADKLDHCQSMCEQYSECLSIHYCAECVEYNCRLLAGKNNATNDLGLTEAFFYVDYHEKVQCTDKIR